MSPQVSENLLAEIYVETDDLLKAFYEWCERKALGRFLSFRRQPQLSASEVATILVAYHLSGYKCFEYYYRECILKTYLHCFPTAPSYKRFVCYIIRVLPLLLLVLLYKCAQSLRTGYYFVDSKKLEVCHIRREHQHKVFKAFARKGKASMGWFYGLKLHLVINHLGEIVSFLLTPANIADNNHSVLTTVLQGLKGKCAGDKAYFTTLFEQFYTQGLQLLVKPKKNMKVLPAFPEDVVLLKQRPLIESVNAILATGAMWSIQGIAILIMASPISSRPSLPINTCPINPTSSYLVPSTIYKPLPNNTPKSFTNNPVKPRFTLFNRDIETFW